MRSRFHWVEVYLLLSCLSLIAGLQSANAQERSSRDLQVQLLQQKKLALVAGNDRYPKAPLNQAVNDAHDIAKVLVGAGFDVQLQIDANLSELDRAIQRLVSKVRPGDVVLFFYAGHGIQIGGENYLVPVDFEITDEADAKYRAYSVSRIQERLENAGARLSILILDACRNNPFLGTRSGGTGLAAMNVGAGTFIALSTSPGKLAYESPSGRNSIFTKNLLLAMSAPGLALDEVFNVVRERVYRESMQRQLPWTSSSVIGQFRFIEPPVPQTADAGGKTSDPSKPGDDGAEGVEQPRVIYAPPPKMPQGKKADSKGFAELSFIVNTEGLPIEIQVKTATESSFGEAAVEALRSWRFEPARKHGKPIPLQATTRHRFNMPAQDLVDALAPRGIARVGDAGVTPPESKSRVLPEYIEAARKVKNAFWVTLYLEIDESGIPNAVKLTGPIQAPKENESKALIALVPLTVEALKQWRFTPALRYGKPVRIAACVQFKFLRRVGLKTPAVPDVGADFVAEVRMP